MNDKLPYEIVCSADSLDDEKFWLAQRMKGIGASEIPTVLGLTPWRSPLQLYAEKVGAVEPEDISEKEAVWFGKELEPIVLKRYQKQTGRKSQRDQVLYRSIEHPWALATLDAWVEIDGIWRPLELKTTSAFKTKDWDEGAPESVFYQCQQQMLVLDEPICSTACVIGGQKLVWCDIERDETAIKKIIYHGERFWKMVQDQTPPAPDGTYGSRLALERLYPADDASVIELPAELQGAADLLDELKNQKKLVEVSIMEKENQIKAALGNASRGFWADGSGYSWTLTRRPEYVVKESEFRFLRRIKTKKGD